MNTPLKDLTIKNNFMFVAVMSDEEKVFWNVFSLLKSNT